MNIFNDPNLEDNSKFDISFSCGDKNYSDISCYLWKNSENIIYIFCQLKQNLINNNGSIKINTKKFIYKGLEINIVQQYDLSFVQLEKTIPFLYSKSQTINLEEGKNTYYLKFNAENYQNEKIIIRDKKVIISLDNCSLEKKQLICPIDKSELEESYIDYFDRGEFNIFYPYPYSEKIPLIQIETIDKVFINNKLPKIDLNITINKLLENYTDTFLFAYEVKTNVSSISNLVTNNFRLNFDYIDKTIRHSCFFKKANGNPLFLLCEAEGNNNSISLSEIKTEIVLNDIHGKYNFYVQPVNNKEKIIINDFDEILDMVLPKTLDFRNNDTNSIFLSILGESNFNKSFRLNPNASKDLECEDLNSESDFKNEKITVKKCLVPKSHFENEQNGYYNLYLLNHMNKYVQYYLISPLRVIFTKDSDQSDERKSDGGSGDGSSNRKNLVGIIVGSVIGGIVLIAAIVIIIIFVKKRKSDLSEIKSTNSEKKILPNSNQIELLEGNNFGNE